MHDGGAAMSETQRSGGTVAVVGLGKIGLPLAIQYISHGRRVIGCDINAQVVAGINTGQCHVHEEPGLEVEVERAVREGKLSATTDTTAATREADVIVVIVPVVVRGQGEVAYEGIDSATAAIGKGLGSGKLVVYETTLPVGTTSGRFRAILERESGLVAGQDFALAYSPERVSSGVIFRDLKTYPKVVGGIDAGSTAKAIAFYSSVLDAPIIEMKSADDAEFVKLAETTYRDVNIAFANELARFADARGLDAFAAIAAANTQPYSHIHQPGVGVGGHCIPVYPYFLMAGSTEGLTLPRRSRVINDQMADYAVERIEAVTGPVRGRAVALLGVAYRGDVKETAFTSAKLLREALEAHGATVYADDPLYSDEELTQLGYTPLPAEKNGEISAIIVQAAHSAYATLDLAAFPTCKAVLDGRKALAPEAVARHGMTYITIGDGRLPVNETVGVERQD
jgi:nucleotide sugar dehydrogenase